MNELQKLEADGAGLLPVAEYARRSVPERRALYTLCANVLKAATAQRIEIETRHAPGIEAAHREHQARLLERDLALDRWETLIVDLKSCLIDYDDFEAQSQIQEQTRLAEALGTELPTVLPPREAVPPISGLRFVHSVELQVTDLGALLHALLLDRAPGALAAVKVDRAALKRYWEDRGLTTLPGVERRHKVTLSVSAK